MTRPIPLSTVIFEPTMPLDGVSLIEASAGTGKTHSIQSIYLRLVLVQGLSVRQILVVTFTDAATKELSDRVRLILHAAREGLDGRLAPDDGNHDRVTRLLALVPDAGLARTRLDAALADFDEATIFTIHGFCNRLLAEWAFECGELFDHDIVASRTDREAELIRDHWRRRFGRGSELDEALAGAAGLHLGSIGEAVAQVLPRHDALVIPALARPTTLTDLRDRMAEIVTLWQAPGAAARNSLGEAIAAGHLAVAVIRGDGDDNVPIADRCRTLDGARPSDPGPELVPAIRALRGSRVDGALKKTARKTWPPCPEVEAFLAATESFCEDLGRWALAEKLLALDEVRRRLVAATASSRELTYDDMLVRVREALRSPATSALLLERLRARYGAALIDEFQDTDSVQWEIFRTVFVDGELPLILVGDPKQAIYAFRSGDVYTYLDAAGLAARTYTLDRNFRSAAEHVAAVNDLFAERRGRPAFLVDGIDHPPQSAQGVDPSRALTVKGLPEPRPLRIRWLAASGDKPLGVGEATSMVARDVTAEVVRMLGDPETRMGGRPLRPSDICVLVATHRQGEIIRRHLARSRVPAVVQKSGNVFLGEKDFGQSRAPLLPETKDLLRVLEALADPRSDRAIRAALATDLFPHDGPRIFDLFVEGNHEAERDEVFAAFHEAAERLHYGGLGAAFEVLDGVFDIRSRVLAGDEGERTLTNLMQGVELLGQKMRQGRMGLNALVAWVRSLPDRRDADADEFRMRLETDSQAVRIMTVFKSKGLEFPVTFVPFLWAAKAGADSTGILRYHDGSRLVIDLAPAVLDPAAPAGSPAGLSADERRQKAFDEDLAEKIRLAYVAATRAAHRTYLYWGAVKDVEATSLHWLFSHRGDGSPSDGLRADLDEFIAGGSILVEDVDPTVQPGLYGSTGPTKALSPTPWRFWPSGQAIPRGFAIASFTSLAHEGHERFEGGLDVDQGDDGGNDEPPEGVSLTPMLEFPAGERTGRAWHEIFETLPFSATRDEIGAVVARVMDAYRLIDAVEPGRTERVEAVTAMVERTLRTPLGAAPDAPRLDAVGASDRVSEMAFDFTLKAGATMGDLHREVAAAWPQWTKLGASFADRHDAVGEGYMTGFIDLAFRVPGSGGDRYFIVDWKSNRIGRRPEAFGPDAVDFEITRRGYALQYLIYTVALDGHLRRTLPGYDYETHMGGVFYVFLRGVDGRPGRSIHHARIPASAVEAAARLLRGGPRE